MIYAVDSALSAVSAYQKKMDVTADNVANVTTDRFKKSRVSMSENKNGGVRAEVDRVDTPGITIDRAGENGPEAVESSNVDLAEEIPNMIMAKAGYTANLKTIESQDQILGNLMDILG